MPDPVDSPTTAAASGAMPAMDRGVVQAAELQAGPGRQAFQGRGQAPAGDDPEQDAQAAPPGSTWDTV